MTPSQLDPIRWPSNPANVLLALCDAIFERRAWTSLPLNHAARGPIMPAFDLYNEDVVTGEEDQ